MSTPLPVPEQNEEPNHSVGLTISPGQWLDRADTLSQGQLGYDLVHILTGKCEGGEIPKCDGWWESKTPSEDLVETARESIAASLPGYSIAVSQAHEEGLPYLNDTLLHNGLLHTAHSGFTIQEQNSTLYAFLTRMCTCNR